MGVPGGKTFRPSYHILKMPSSWIKRKIDMQKASHLVLADSHCYRRELRGDRLLSEGHWTICSKQSQITFTSLQSGRGINASAPTSPAKHLFLLVKTVVLSTDDNDH